MNGVVAFRKLVREGALSIAHLAQMSRLRWEAVLDGWQPGTARIRVMTTACFSFPIYSHTFVYREVAELARGGFNVRFVYSELGAKEKPSGAAQQIWKLRRMVILSDRIASRDMQSYVRRMPERVAELIVLISESSGLSPQEVRAHRHFQQAFSFARAAECWKAQYLHSYFFYERTLFALVASHLLGIPRGVSCYADHVLDDYSLKLVSLHLRSCAVVVATSGRIKAELESIAGRALPHAIMKPNAIDVRQFKAAPRASIGPERPIRLVTVCRIHPKKGLIYLVDAARLLRDKGIQFFAQIVGEPDDDADGQVCFQTLKQRIAAYGLEPVVSLEGRRNSGEVREFLVGADIFVSPFIELPNGDKDGIPTALLEAMAAGCAIVTTGAGSISEVVGHEREGLVVPQRDAEALADAILRLMHDRDLSRRMSHDANLRVHQQFDSRYTEDVFHAHVRAALTEKASQVKPR